MSAEALTLVTKGNLKTEASCPRDGSADRQVPRSNCG